MSRHYALCLLPLIFACAVAADAAATAKPALPPAPDGVTIKQDVTYLEPGRYEKLDLYLPSKRASDVRSPGIVIIHGGGWVGGDKAAAKGFELGTTLAKAGYVCVSVNYMMQAGKRWPTNILDCKNAVRFLRKNAKEYQIDTEHIGVVGGSAGGHLALMVAYTSDVPELEPKEPYPGVSDQVQAVVDFYGITNILTRQKTDEKGNPTGVVFDKAALLVETREQNPKLWELASPVYHVGKKTPPTLIAHGKIDTTVDWKQATELDKKLTESGVEHKLVMIDGVGHSFGLQTWRRKALPIDMRPVLIGFFDKYLKRK